MAIKKDQLAQGVEHATNELETVHKEARRGEREATGKNVVFNLSLPKLYKERLQEHFKDKGLRFVSGVRTVIFEYMEKHGLLK